MALFYLLFLTPAVPWAQLYLEKFDYLPEETAKKNYDFSIIERAKLDLKGEGTKNKPYEIHTAKDLAYFRDIVNEGIYTVNMYFSLAENISLEAYNNWMPIGTLGKPFRGNFIGNGKIISNLKIKDESRDNVGLFGYIYAAAADVNVGGFGLENANIIARNNVGGVAGYTDGTGSFICNSNNIYVSGVINGAGNVGSVIGNVGENGYVSKTYSIATVHGNGNVGGIAGLVDGGVNNSFALNPQVKGETYVGRVVGDAYGELENNYAFYGLRGYDSTAVWLLKEEIWFNRGLSNLDGENITAEEISKNKTFAGLFKTLPKHLIVKNNIDREIVFADGETIYADTEFSHETKELAKTVEKGKEVLWKYSYKADVEKNANSSLGENNKPLTAGAYKVTAYYEDENSKGSKEVTFVINKAEVSDKIEFTAGSAVYEDKDYPYNVAKVNGIAGTTNSGWTYSYGKNGIPHNAGTYSVTAKYKDDNNYGEQTVVFVVEKANVNSYITFENGDATYENRDYPHKTATINTAFPGKTNSLGLRYEYVTSVPHNAGKYSIVAHYEDDNNKGSKEAIFTVNKAEVAENAIIFNGGSLTYTGNKLSYEARANGFTGNALECTYSYESVSEKASLKDKSPLTAGDYNVVANCEDENNKGSKAATFTVDKADVSGKIKFFCGETTYTGEELSCEPARISGITGTDNAQWIYTYRIDSEVKNNENAKLSEESYDPQPLTVGAYKAIAHYEDDNNMGSSEEFTFVVNPRDVSTLIVFGCSEVTYTGEERSCAEPATVPSSLSGATNSSWHYESPDKDSQDHELSDIQFVNAGEYHILAFYKDDNNFGVGTVTFTIRKASYNTIKISDLRIPQTQKTL